MSNTIIAVLLGVAALAFGIGYATHAVAHVYQGPHNDASPAEPQPADAEESARLHACQVFGVRAAWGAVAAYAGAPRTIRNHPKDVIEPIFMGKADVPTDGIWIDIDALRMDGELDDYVEAALYGYDAMIEQLQSNPGMPMPGFEELIAGFYNGCKQRSALIR